MNSVYKIKEVKKVLKLINTGLWLQLEGSIGRYCNDFIESGILIKDIDKTKKNGPVKFKNGYGINVEQYLFKIDYDRLQEINFNQ